MLIDTLYFFGIRLPETARTTQNRGFYALLNIFANRRSFFFTTGKKQ